MAHTAESVQAGDPELGHPCKPFCRLCPPLHRKTEGCSAPLSISSSSSSPQRLSGTQPEKLTTRAHAGLRGGCPIAGVGRDPIGSFSGRCLPGPKTGLSLLAQEPRAPAQPFLRQAVPQAEKGCVDLYSSRAGERPCLDEGRAQKGRAGLDPQPLTQPINCTQKRSRQWGEGVSGEGLLVARVPEVDLGLGGGGGGVACEALGSR